MKKGPVKNQEEFNEVEKYLIETASRVMGITEKAAKLRVRAIIQSGIMSKFGPADQEPFQIAIDAAMMVPQLGESESD